MRKVKTDASFRKASIRAAVLVLAVGLGMSLLVSGGTFAKWTAAISQMTGANIQIGDWVAVEPPVISTEANLPAGNVGVEYRHQLEASNSGNVTWTFTNLYGSLPSGLKLSPDGVISGTPTYASTYSFRATVKNIAGSDERTFTLVIHPVAPVFADSQVLPDAFDGKAYPSTMLTASGQSKIYEITSGTLPDGLILQRSGTISGIPVGYGTFTFTVKVSNGGGSDLKEFTINLNSDFPYITTTALPDATKNVWYSQPLAGSGPSPTYALVSGSLPSGMTLDASTGRISGTSNVHGLSNFTISKTNAMGTATKDLSIYVRYAAPTFTSYYNPPTVRKNVAYSYQLVGTGEEVTYAITKGSLPEGIALNTTTGLISGTTSVVGNFDLTITKTNETGEASKSFTLSSLLVAPVIKTNWDMPDAYLDTYYELANTATGEEIVWSATGLVNGMSIDPDTGIISGTPISISNSYISVTATNNGGSSTVSLLFTVYNQLPVITTTSIPNGEVGKPYSEQIVAIGVNVRYSVSGTLPAGITFNTSTGVLSGTPTVAGTFSRTFQATTSGGTVNQILTLIIDRDVPTITVERLDPAMQGVSYTKWFTGKGIDSTYAITAGSLPAGVSLSPTHGYINGTPSVTANPHGPYTFTVTKTNSRGSVSQEFTLNVVYQTPTLTGYAAITQTRLGQNYTYTLAGVGNGVTYSITDGALPGGMALNESTGVISGTSTVTGDFAFTIQKTNESGTVSKGYTFKVTHVAPSMQTKVFDRATIGVPYSMQIKATGLDIVYSIGYGTLPDGVSLDPSTGVISGTPTVAGSFLIRVYATNSGGQAEVLDYFNSDDVLPTVTTTSLPDAMVGAPYSARIEAVGENLIYGTLSSINLPGGLSIDSKTGIISGTPRSAFNTTSIPFTIRNSGGTVVQKIPMTVVTQAPTITIDSLPNGIVGQTYSQAMSGDGSSNTFSITAGSLPPGINFSTSNGSLTGKPSTRGTYTFTVTKTNVSGTVSKELTLIVSYTKPTFTTAAGALIAGKTGSTYSVDIYGNGDNVTYRVSEGTLPPGLSIAPYGSNSYARITGTPTTPGNYTFTIHKSNLDGEVSRQFSINVTGTPIIASLSNEPSAGLILLRSNPFL